MEMKKDIRDLDETELLKFCLSNNLPKFRAKQIHEWLWKKRAVSFAEMTSLPFLIRNLLIENFCINPISIHNTITSKDKTIKYSLKLYDNLLIEGVLIPSKKRVTACVSSQVGCSLSCVFCATGTLKLDRNLTAAEIYDQVFILNQQSINQFKRPLSNIVFMGMGEPLLNYKNVLESVKLITTKKGLAISPKRITISTAGITKKIKQLAKDIPKIHLAISLHSAIDEKRNILMPLNKKVDLAKLKEAVKYYYETTKNRITYEYILFQNINDSLEDAKKLEAFAKFIPSKVNLIEYNTVRGIEYTKSSKKRTTNFIQYLESKNIIVNLRKSKGDDIAAACGQLVNDLK